MDNASEYDEADDHFFEALMGQDARNVVDEEALKFGYIFYHTFFFMSNTNLNFFVFHFSKKKKMFL